MLNSIKKLSGCRILATDGEVGAVAEAVYFDDEQWVLRYLVVDTRAWLRGRRVLISPYAVTFIDWEARTIAVNLTRTQVEHSPDIDTHQPVSRQKEAEYHRYYGYPQYWPTLNTGRMRRTGHGVRFPWSCRRIRRFATTRKDAGEPLRIVRTLTLI
jgi:hypothetical protein